MVTKLVITDRNPTGVKQCFLSSVTHHEVKCSIITKKAETDTKLWALSDIQPAEHCVTLSM